MVYDGIVVKSMTIINYGLVEQLLKKKIKKKLDSYLQFLISVLDDEDPDSGHLMFALNDLEKYRRTIMNNYRIYLDITSNISWYQSYSCCHNRIISYYSFLILSHSWI